MQNAVDFMCFQKSRGQGEANGARSAVKRFWGQDNAERQSPVPIKILLNGSKQLEKVT